MMDERENPKFEEWLRQHAGSYHSPLPTPRDEMWQRIVAERKRRAETVFELRPWMRWSLAAAAVLALGIGIGRWTANPGSTDNGIPVATAPVDTSRPGIAYQIAATQYLSRTETFLTAFRADLASGSRSARFASQARNLLVSTRLMLDSPAADDARLRNLLEDLELVLVQISQLDTGGGSAHNTDLITQGMDQTNVLPKLRSAIPAGPVPVRTEGAL